jgi:hypothetical protein
MARALSVGEPLLERAMTEFTPSPTPSPQPSPAGAVLVRWRPTKKSSHKAAPAARHNLSHVDGEHDSFYGFSLQDSPLRGHLWGQWAFKSGREDRRQRTRA